MVSKKVKKPAPKNKKRKKLVNKKTEPTSQLTVAIQEKEPPPAQTGTAKLNSIYFLFSLMGIVFIGCYKMLAPYLNTIIMAFILAVLFAPIHNRIEAITRGRKNLAAFLSCILITIVVLIPLSFMLLSAIQQGVTAFSSFYEWIETGHYKTVLEHPMMVTILSWGQDLFPDLQKLYPDLDIKTLKIDKALMKFSASIGKTMLNQGGHIAGNITSVTGKFFLMIFTFFFLIRDEKKIVDTLLHLIPLKASQEKRIVEKIRDVSKSALLGTFITAFAQGAAGGIAFALCGLPGLFWGMSMAFASLIPMVGTALIWVPAVFYLGIIGHYKSAIFLFVWSVVVVGGIDNFVRPLFMQGGAEMNTLVIFFAILGGLQYFGLIGLLYGPIIFGLAIVLIYIYKIEFQDFLDRQHSQ